MKIDCLWSKKSKYTLKAHFPIKYIQGAGIIDLREINRLANNLRERNSKKE